MVRLSALFLATASAAIVAAVPSPNFAVKSSVNLPKGWVKHSTPSPNQHITLRIALQQPNFHKLESELYEISDPESSRWTDHLTKEQVEELIAPHPTSITLVDDYLTSHGIDVSAAERTPAKDYVIVTVTVAQAEKLMDTEYSVYKHVGSGTTALRTLSYSLPTYLHDHIDVRRLLISPNYLSLACC